MRILRVRLRDFRGVSAEEVVLPRNGVTILAGPNEIGKSTIALAVRVLLDELDSSRKAEIKALQPAGRDVGPEAELDLESGPYRLTIRKRWLKETLTELRVDAPRPESLAGREAHERLRRILEESTDLGLWNALRVDQGGSLLQAELAGNATLSAALDRAAGSTPTGGREESLYDRAQAAYRECWTDGGKEKGTAAELTSALESAGRTLAEVEERIARVQRDVERFAALDGELRDLEVDRERGDALVRELEAEERTVAALRGTVDVAEARADGAARTRDRMDAAIAERAKLAAELERATAERDRLASEAAARATEVVAAREELARVEAAVTEASAAREAADALERGRRTERDRALATAELARLEAVRQRVTAGRTRAEQLDGEIAGMPADATRLADVRTAAEALRIARARLDVGAASVEVEALGAGEIALDGQTEALAAGEVRRRPVTGQLEVVLPGRLRVTVRSGSGGDALHAAFADAERRLAEACAAIGVTDPEGAEAAAALRADRVAERTAVATEAKEALHGVDAERLPDLDERMSRLRATLAVAPAASLPPLAADEVADGGLAAAARRAEAAREREQEARATRDGTATRVTGIAADDHERRVRLQVAGDAVVAAETRLAAARAEVADADLDAAGADARTAVAAAVAELERVRRELAAAAPEALELRLRNARQVAQDLATRREQLRDERTMISTRLSEAGEAGLAAQRDAALSAQSVAADAVADWRRRADARKLLFDTLRQAREAAHRSYAGPLRERIEQLGSVVFGDGFSVTLDQELRIVERTLHGRTIPFSQVSGGAGEQMGLIVRLAAAMIVEPDGVPVILDDTLGFTDRSRLEKMGAILALAGRTTQVIILTCDPDRFRQVGGATVIQVGTERV